MPSDQVRDELAWEPSSQPQVPAANYQVRGVERVDRVHTLPFPTQVHHWEKWAKFVARLQWVRDPERGGQADTTRLRQIAGLGVHITEIYPLGRSYLKSFFNAIEAFRFSRDVDG